MAWVLEFEDQCELLRRNDPATTTFEDDEYSAYGRQLGEALRNNTHVSSLNLLTRGVLETPVEQRVRRQETDDDKLADIQHAIDPLLHYLQTSAALRLVNICENGEADLDPLVTAAILAAAHQNPNVQELVLALSNIPVQFFQTFLPTTTSLTKLYFILPEDVDGTVVEQCCVTKGIESNTSLQILEMECSSALSTAILMGLANKPDSNHHHEQPQPQQPCHLQELTVQQPYDSMTVTI